MKKLIFTILCSVGFFSLSIVKAQWTEDFESYSSGSWPTTWTADGNATDNSTNYVDNTVAYTGSKSLKLFGLIGGCWAALAYHQISLNPPFEVELAIRNGDETLSGCHPFGANIGLRKGTSWTNPSRVFIKFKDGGIYSSSETLLGSYNTLYWYIIKVRYERPSPSTVKLSYWIDGTYKGSETISAITEEDQLTNFEVTVQEGSAWFDEVKISLASTPGEDCSDPVTISGTSGSESYTTTGYLDDYYANCESNTSNDKVYYLSTAVPDGYTLEFWTSGDDYDVILYGAYGNCTGTLIGCVDDPDGTMLTWENTTDSDQNVWFFVDGYGSSNGNGTLNWNIVQSGNPGEDCSDPVTISGTSGSENYTTTGYINDYTGSGGGNGGDKVFYLSTSIAIGHTLEFWTSGDDYNVVLYGRRGSCAGTEIAWLNDPDGNVLTWNNDTGSDQNIWFFVDGWGSSVGSATLNWNIVQSTNPGEDCSNPVTISGTSGSENYNTTGYAGDYSAYCESNTSNDKVFYLSTAVPNGQTLEFWTTGDDYDVILYGSYGSCGGNSIGCVDDPDGTVLTWENTTGSDQNVWIVVDGYGSSSGSATLNWNIVQSTNPGEDCSDPVTISGTSGSVSYTTTGYMNNYEGSGGGTGEDKVFYFNTAVPNGQALEFWTSGADYDVVLYGRYSSCTGNEIGWVRGTDEILIWENSTGSEQNVWIFADGWSGSDGSGTLYWAQVECIAPSQPSPITGNISVCLESSEPYSITNVSEVTYLWEVTGETVSGNGNSVSVTWSSTGNQTITVTPSNSCGDGPARKLTVAVNDIPSQSSSINGRTSVCLGDIETYSITPVSEITYSWEATGGIVSGNGNSVSVTWNSTGNQTVTVTPSNSCGPGTPRFQSVNVEDAPSQPSAINGSVDAYDNNTYNYSVTNISGVNYDWSTSSSCGTISGSGNSISVTWTSIGTRDCLLTVTPTNNCGTGTSQTLNIIVTGINESGLASSIKLYPNPAQGLLSFELENLEGKQVFLNILNMNGHLLYSRKFVNHGQKIQENIDISNLPNGIYLIKLVGEKEIIIDKLIVQ